MPSPHPRKQFAQHWLRSDVALNKIIAAAELSPSDRVLEIGPGTGILTRSLVNLAASVLSVEIDRDLCKKLVSSFGKLDNFLLLQGDFLTLDLDDCLSSFPAFQNPNKVVANIPYNITGPILEKLLGKISSPQLKPFDSIVLLVQKEVAERITAKPGTKAFGALSVRVQYLAQTELIHYVPAKAFYPPPKVDSAVVRLQPRNLEPAADNPKILENLVTAGFREKRKMLHNNLKAWIDKDALDEMFAGVGIDSQVRAEQLNLVQWVSLSNKIAARSSIQTSIDI